MNWEAFFALHDGLPREGPGEAADVVWATGLAGVKRDARVLDAGCGPGADIPALLQAAPDGQVTAAETHGPFVARIRAAHAGDPRVRAVQADMLAPEGPFDFIWSAGAVYFHGIGPALTAWKDKLAPGGTVAFSEPCLFTAEPSEAARSFWHEYPGITDAAGIAAQVAAAGFSLVATRKISDAAWEAYFRPMEARIATLRPGADADLAAVLDEGAAEAAGWRAAKDETGYLLVLAAPQ